MMVKIDGDEKNLCEAIEQMPGEGGWWKSSSQARIEKLTERLLAHFTEQEAFDIVEEAFNIGRAEYGG